MKNLLHNIRGLRVVALLRKELRQIKRDRKFMAALILPPTVQLILFGFALNPNVTGLQLGVADDSRSVLSRELTAAFEASNSFQIKRHFASAEELGQALSAGQLDGGLIFPTDFARQRERGATAQVQLVLDAVNSNTAGIASGYAERIIAAFNQQFFRSEAAVALQTNAATASARVALLYNPGLRNSWFILTGVLGILLIMNGSLVAAGAMVKEKEVGTIEQLLMTPAAAWEIITAKITPLFLLLSLDVWIALGVGWLVFAVPVRGSVILLYAAGGLCVLAGIGLGTFLATFSRSLQQAQLLGFFVNPPIAMISGATTPVEAMPYWMQMFTWINPVSHFSTIARGILLKGVGLEILYPHLLALVGFAFLLMFFSVRQFRKQLG
jgi:ABC-2 type transport system permease protein